VKVVDEAEAPGGLPEMVTTYVPIRAAGETVIVTNAEAPVVTGVIEAGVKNTDTSLDGPDTWLDKLTPWAMPAVRVAVTIALVDCAAGPSVTLPLAGLTERL